MRRAAVRRRERGDEEASLREKDTPASEVSRTRKGCWVRRVFAVVSLCTCSEERIERETDGELDRSWSIREREKGKSDREREEVGCSLKTEEAARVPSM